MRYYVLSDVHGFFSETEKALRESGYYEDAEDKKIVICGDLLDRGKEPNEVIEWVKGLICKEEVVLVRGNHEDLICELAEDLVVLVEDLTYSKHMLNGTVNTLSEITKMSKSYMRQYPEATRARFYQSVFYKDILPVMVDYFETDRYIFTHGWLPCLVSNERLGVYVLDPDWRNADKKAWENARWISGQRAAHAGAIERGKTIVCGHESALFGHVRYEKNCSGKGKDVVYTPYYAEGVIAIDACTAISRRVNVLVLEE